MTSNEYEIDMREYLKLIKRGFWIIVSVIALSISIGGLLSYYVFVPIYETSTTLMINKPTSEQNTIEYSDVLANQMLVKTYGEIIKSRTISSQVIKNLNLDYTPEQLRKMINVSLVQDTEIIELKVSHMNPNIGASIANELANVFIKDINRLMKVDNVQVIDKAHIPAKAVNHRPVVYMIIAGLLGLIISLGIIFLREYLDHTIKTPDEIEKYVGLPVIGIIPISQ